MKTARQYLVTGAGVLLGALGLFLIKTVPQPQGILVTLPYLCIGVGCGMFGHGLGEIINRKALSRDPKLSRQKEIEEKDERNRSHACQAKARGFDMMTYVFAALLLAFALMGSSIQIVIPFVAAYLFVELSAVYFRIKIDRED